MKNPENGTHLRASACENTRMPEQQPQRIGLLAGIATVSFQKDFAMTDDGLLNASNFSKDVGKGRPGNLKET